MKRKLQALVTLLNVNANTNETQETNSPPLQRTSTSEQEQHGPLSPE